MGGLWLLQRFAHVHPEVVRKSLHMSMGLTTISFPWLFDRAWPVIFLAVASSAGLLALRLVPWLRGSVGKVLGGVSRISWGEIYFVIAVAVLFTIYVRQPGGDPNQRTILYCVPLLLLTVSDAAAALIGISYGRLRYTTAEGFKSAEGSIAFFTTAFFVVHVPLLLSTDIGRPETLLIGVLIAWLATMFEAISWRGLDNLALPLITYLLLSIYFELTAAELLIRLWVTAGLIVFLAVYRSRSTLQGSGVLGAFLVGYICWALDGWRWLVAPLTLFLTYTLLSPRTEVNSRRIHNIDAVISISSAGLVWLFLAKILDQPGLLLPFTLAFAAHLAIIGIARLAYDYPQLPARMLLAMCVLKAWLLLFLPYVILDGLHAASFLAAGLALPAVALAASAFYFLQPGIDDCPTDTSRWFRQGLHAAAGSLVGLVPVYLL
jgi:phytol kinase